MANSDVSVAYNVLLKDNASAGLKHLGKETDLLHGKAKALIAGFAGGLVGAKAVDFLKESINQASDLNEAGTKMQAIFGTANDQVVKFANTGAKALGQNKLAVEDAAATFGTFGKAAGLAGKPLGDFATGFTQLSTDLASFYNTSPADAVEAISAALRGESEPMRKYGVLLDDATLRQEAMRLGLIKTTKTALTPQQKVLAAQAVIYKQTKDAQGDFARTSGGLANQQRILTAQMDDLKGKIGSGLLPVMVKLATFANDEIVPAISGFVDGMQSGKGVGGEFASVVGDIGGAAKTAWSAAKPLFGFIGDHPDLFKSLAVDAVTLGAGLKAFSTLKGMGLGKGAASIAGAPAGVTPVYVTNMTGTPGIGGPGVPGAPGGGSKWNKGVLGITPATVIAAGALNAAFNIPKNFHDEKGAQKAVASIADRNASTVREIQRALGALAQVSVAEQKRVKSHGGSPIIGNKDHPLFATNGLADADKLAKQLRARLNAALIQQDRMDNPKFAAVAAARGKAMADVLKNQIVGGSRAAGASIKTNIEAPISRSGDAANQLLRNILAIPTSREVAINFVTRGTIPGGGLGGVHRDSDFTRPIRVHTEIKLDTKKIAEAVNTHNSTVKYHGKNLG